MSNQMWMVRAGRGAALLDTFLDSSMVGVGLGKEIGAPGDDVTRKALGTRMKAAYPTWADGKITNVAGQLYRFLADISLGDHVVTYDPGQRRYLLGTVESDATYEAEAEPPYRRRVKWTTRVARDGLSVATRNTLGAIQSLFLLNEDAAGELRAQAVALDAPDEEVVPRQTTADDTTMEALREDVVEKSAEFIEDMISGLDWDQMQDLVAGVLRAMGYRTRVSPKGSDRGVDIFASPDGLGLQEPRVFVEVKHRRGTAMGSNALRAFMGGRQPGDRCLYVSTGGFTKEARYEAERSSVPLTLIGLPELRQLLVEHYEQLDTETRQLVPLTRLYWPADS